RKNLGTVEAPSDSLPSHSPVEELAPAAVALASGLVPSGQVSVRGDGGVVEAVPRRHVCVAPADVENLATRVRIRLAAGAVRPGNGRARRRAIRQGSIAGASTHHHSPTWGHSS